MKWLSFTRLSVIIIFLTLAASALLSACEKNDAAPETAEIRQYVLDENLPAPQFGTESGVYDDGFLLEMTCEDGLTVRYTLDGSLPDCSSPVYEGPIEIKDRTSEPNILSAYDAALIAPQSEFKPGNVNKCTVIRAACFNDKTGTMSGSATASYLVGLKPYGVKVISLSLDEADLFDYETGIYVLGKTYDIWYEQYKYTIKTDGWEYIPGNYSQKGREWERPVHADIIDRDGRLLCSQDLGIRTMGAASRRNYQKNFRLYARKEYGKKNIKCPLIEGLGRERDGQPLEKFKSFVLRCGGNDNETLFMRDPYIQKLVEDCDFSTQGTEPAVVFIDGEYWGLYTITEDYSDDYIEDNYDIDKKNVVIIKLGEIEEGETSDIKLLNSMMEKKTRADFSKPEDYEWICDTIDIDSFIDYSIVNIFTFNQDGLYGDYGENNWRIWRSRDPVEGNEYGDCRWRFMLYDTEYSLGLYCDPSKLEKDYIKNDTLAEIGKREKIGFTGLFLKLLGNDDFRQRFITRFMDLRNDVFVPDNSIKLLNEMADQYRPLMPEQIKRNGPEWAKYFGSETNYFNSNLDTVKKFLRGRYEYTEEMLRGNFGLGDTYTLTVSVNDPAGGTVAVNTITPKMSGGSWSGAYFTDYPVAVTAVPAEGYIFKGWKGAGGKSETVSLKLRKDTEMIACFEKQ